MDVLVVDDIRESRRDLCALVAELGHEVKGVGDGEEALAAVRAKMPDLVLLDLLMPGLDGFEVARRMRERSGRHWVPIIATSSLQGDEHVVQALRSGADDYLARPVSPALLEAKLRHYEGVLALQARLAMLAQRQRDILDNILDPVITLDASGRVQDFNRAALALRLLDGRPLVSGSHCEEIFGVDLEELLTLRECSVRSGDRPAFPAEVGSSQWHENGAVHYTLVLRDLTERHQVERMKDEFLATVSHELRTPLTSVVGALGLLAGNAAGALPQAAMPLVEMARRNGERLGRLIDDVLDITKLEGDRMALHLRPQFVRPLLRDAISANAGFAVRGDVTLVLEEGDPTREPEVALDADRFLQVMANLLSNAIKHSPPGESVRVSLRPDAQGLRVTVRDRGPGVPANFRERLFDKFSQADGSDRRVKGGTGLGLHITRMLVERMGGRISVDDVEGEGASFSVYLPRSTSMPTDRPVLLLVDADFDTHARLARWLGHEYRVEGATTLAQAELVASRSAPSAFIGNPQAQGSADAFCAGLRRLAGGLPVLLLGDSIDDSFRSQVDLPWLGLAECTPETLRAVLRSMLQPAGPTGS
jgi:signal transduction histidine kinase